MIQQHRATIDDLYTVEGPAELVGGRIIRDMTGERPAEVAGNIFVSLRAYVKQTGRGKAHCDNLGYVARVEATDRDSFCPDASYHTRPPAANPMRFVQGAPDFAVEVRSENDYGGQAVEDRLAEKRSDYFTAGTLVVWDVDPVNEVVTIYRAADPTNPTVCRRGQTADAEPAVPGWRMAVDEIFA
jgi:Uma2 family endonuclease